MMKCLKGGRIISLTLRPIEISQKGIFTARGQRTNFSDTDCIDIVDSALRGPNGAS